MKNHFFAGGALILCLLLAASSRAATLTVTSPADDGGAGTLRSVLADAQSGDTITFATNLSGAGIVLTNGGGLVLNRNVTIDAKALARGIQLNGNNQYTVLTVTYRATAVLNALTITNGNSSVCGGIFNNGGRLTVNDSTLSGNTGCGIVNEGVTTLNDSILSGNTSDSISYGVGGGIYNGSGTLIVNSSTLSGNTGGGCGGILNNGVLTVNASTFSGNRGYRNNSCSFSSGGIFNGSGTLIVNSSTLSGNSDDDGQGGGIFIQGGRATVDASTLSGNNDGGIYNHGMLMLTNSIVAGNNTNSGQDIYNKSTLTYGGSNLVQSVLNTGKITGSPSSTAAPNLAPLGNYGGPTATMRPLPGSPAIDGGSYTANTFTNDQRGLPRTFGTHVDLGAVEIQQGVMVVTSAADDNGPGTLRLVLAGAQAGDTVTFATNLSGASIGLTLGGLILNRDVTIDATMLPGGIQINGNGRYTVLTVGSHVIAGLNALTITNGNASSAAQNYAGAGIFNDGGIVTVNASRVSGNKTTSAGGGIYNQGGTVTVNTSTLAGNIALLNNSYEDGFGGAIYNDGNGTVTVNNSLLSDNTAYGGGGICNEGGMVMVNNSTLSNNSQCGIFNKAGMLTVNASTLSSNSGSGIFNNGTVTVSASLLSGNSQSGIYNQPGIYNQSGTVTVNASTLSSNGYGGIYNDCSLGQGTVTVNNSTFRGNTDFGGIYNDYKGTVTVNNSTLSGNSGSDSGGITSHGTLDLINCILAGNSDNHRNEKDIYDEGILNYGGSNLVQSVTSSGTTNGSPSSMAAPNLAPLGNYGGPTATMPPLPGSPAINGGSYAANRLADDQRGLPRTFGTHVDLGAVEFQQSPSAQTLAAGSVGATNAILNGLIVPADLTNQVGYTWYFAYGTTQNYGSHSATNTGTVSIATKVSQWVNGLQPGRLYHYELFTQPHNGAWLTGGDQTLTTPVTTD